MHKAMLIVLLILPLAVLPLIGMAAAQATAAAGHKITLVTCQ